MTQTHTVAIVDDHSLIIEAIKTLLLSEKNFPFVGGFNSGQALKQYLQNHEAPSILLLDIQLQQEDGISLCKELTQKFPNMNIVMLSSLTQPALVMDALKKGAKGYLPKNMGQTELIEALQAVTEGRTYLHKSISLIPDTTPPSAYAQTPKLTRREREILELILEEKTTPEIADALHITVSTVETHRAALLQKTGSKNVVGLIKFTLEKGLLD